MPLLDSTQVAVQFIIFIAALIAAVEVSRGYLALIKLRMQTRVSAKAFFICCALTHLGLALHKSDDLFFQIVGYLQAVSIVAFLIYLATDLRAALSNLRQAFKVIQLEHGETGDRIIAAIIAALRKGP